MHSVVQKVILSGVAVMKSGCCSITAQTAFFSKVIFQGDLKYKYICMKFMPFIPSRFTSDVCWEAKSTYSVNILVSTFY